MPQVEQVLPKYLQIAGYIRDQIVRGDLQPGDEVPSERELARSWAVARPTATKALEALRVQGFVESRQGAGTFVRARGTAPRARERYDRAREHGTMYSDAESVEFLAAEVVPGPEHVLEALLLPEGSKVIRRVRLISSKVEGPLELSTSWFDAELAEVAPRLLELDRIRGGTDKYIASLTGLHPAYARDQVMARLANADERRNLRLPRPAAVLVHRLILCARDDRALQFDEGIYPEGRWTLRQDFVVDPAGPV